VALAALAEAEALPPAQSGSATSMRGSSTRSLRACIPGAVAVVAVAPDRGGDARILRDDGDGKFGQKRLRHDTDVR